MSMQLLLSMGAYGTLSIPSSSDATFFYVRKVTVTAAQCAHGRDVCRHWRVALQSDRGAAGGGSGGHDRMKQTAEAAAAPASLNVAQDAAAPGAAGPPDADGQQALQQYLVNLCQPAALVSSKRQRRVDNNVGQSYRSSHRRFLRCHLVSLAPCQAQCAPGAGFA